MKPNKIEQNKQYEITIGKNITVVRVVEIEHRVNGTLVFQCENIKTGKPMTIADAGRFRKEVKDEKTNPTNKTEKQACVPRADGKVSGLEAALIVLRESGEAMNIKQIMEKINERNLARLAGKTPGATVSAAIQREINGKSDSRFEKAGKGLFRAK